MFKALANILRVPELRKRLLFTAGIIILVRLAANITCPGVNPKALAEYFVLLKNQSATGGLLDMFNLFSGGALSNFAIGILGIMPFITASIIMQLLTPVIPSLEKMSREGEAGRGRINQYTRYLTVVVATVQAVAASFAMLDPQRLGLPAPSMPLIIGSKPAFILISVVVLVATSVMVMWLGEQITDRGIGNGASVIITINIIARLPQATMQLIDLAVNGDASGSGLNGVKVLLLGAGFFLVTAFTVWLSQGFRRVPIQMARKTVGNQIKGGSTYMPLKVNYANVMPIIFASALMQIPAMALAWLGKENWAALFSQPSSLFYMVLYAVLIIGFSFFWVANQFNPVQISDNLKREGAYIPGVRPGQPTAQFLDATMTRITFAGAMFLTFLALIPSLIYGLVNIPYLVASFFGGTSLLIMVGVVLDTMRQLESHLTMRNYEGFLKSGRLRGRNG